MTATAPASPAAEGTPHPLIARFAGDLARIWPEGDKLGLAVSGGPDSLALLLLAEAVMPGRVEVATVDHGLRPESTSEAANPREARSSPAGGGRTSVRGCGTSAIASSSRLEAVTGE